MKENTKIKFGTVSLSDFIFVLFYSYTIINLFIASSFKYPVLKVILSNYIKSTILIFTAIVYVFIIWLALSSYFKKNKLFPLITLFPFVLLFLWGPYQTSASFLTPIIIVMATQLCFFIILANREHILDIPTSKQNLLIAIPIALYIIIFGYTSIQQFSNFSFFDSTDFAIFNQTFWNTIHGRFFENSTYGSNFTCHNAWFFLLLVPLYYIFPHPLTLLVLKIILLGLSAIPFYLIVKHSLKGISAFPLTIAYLLYPFLVSQNFNPPFEITYLPFFLLFTYYFFIKNRFWPFLIFLILSISIKEHISSIAIMFGVFALFYKRNLNWITAPILLGIIWGIFSLVLISHFQRIYPPNPDATWFITSIKAKFLSVHANNPQSIKSSIKFLNIFNGHTIKSALTLLFVPLGVIPPLLSPVGLLGLPEFILNLLSDRPGMFSTHMHYNIIVSCFLLIGATEGIKKISLIKKLKNTEIRSETLQLLLCIFVLSSVFLCSHTWVESARCTKNLVYSQTIKEALSYIPKDVFVTVPRNVAIHISNRKNYSFTESKDYGDYILVDKNCLDILSEKTIRKNYAQVFNKNGVIVLKIKAD